MFILTLNSFTLTMTLVYFLATLEVTLVEEAVIDSFKISSYLLQANLLLLTHAVKKNKFILIVCISKSYVDRCFCCQLIPPFRAL